MHVILDIAGAFVLLATLVSGCYAHTGAPGPSCAQDSTQQGCYPPVHDQKKPK
jgi:hypothetical protein